MAELLLYVCLKVKFKFTVTPLPSLLNTVFIMNCNDLPTTTWTPATATTMNTRML